MSKIAPLIIVSANFDDLPDLSFVRKLFSFDLHVETNHLSIGTLMIRPKLFSLQVTPSLLRDPDRARSLSII